MKTATFITHISVGVFALAVCFWSAAFASPVAAPGTGYAYQPSGLVLTLQQRGDGRQVWYETPDGYTVLRNEQYQWVYAKPSVEGSIRALSSPSGVVASELLVGVHDPVSAGIPKGLTTHRHTPDSYSTAIRRSVGGSNPINDVTGTIPVVLLLGYYDDVFSAADCASCGQTPASHFQNIMFAQGADVKSVADYFTQMSQGALLLSAASEVHGTQNDGIVGWLRLGAATPEGLELTTSSYKSNQIAADAVNAAMDYMDFTAYDVDGNGTVTSNELGIVVILAGYEASYGRNESGEALSEDTTSPRVWAQSRSFVTGFSGVAVPTQTSGGKTVTVNTSGGGMTYSIMGERHGNHGATMGIIAHELGHSVFALPDLYDTSGASNGVGVWSSMGFGSWGQALGDTSAGMTPVAMDAWSRVALGWVAPQTPASGQTVAINAAAGGEGTIVKLPAVNANEYFLVENRQPVGYDEGLTLLLFSTNFGGLAFWHIDDSVGIPGLNNDNSDPAHKRVDLVAAVGDGALDNKTSYGQKRNLYYDGNATELNADTDPGTRLHSGEDSDVEMSQVSVPDLTMTAKVVHNGDVATTTTSAARAASGESGGGGGGGAVSLLLFGLLPVAGLRRRRRRAKIAPSTF